MRLTENQLRKIIRKELLHEGAPVLVTPTAAVVRYVAKQIIILIVMFIIIKIVRYLANQGMEYYLDFDQEDANIKKILDQHKDYKISLQNLKDYAEKCDESEFIEYLKEFENNAETVIKSVENIFSPDIFDAAEGIIASGFTYTSVKPLFHRMALIGQQVNPLTAGQKVFNKSFAGITISLEAWEQWDKFKAMKKVLNSDITKKFETDMIKIKDLSDDIEFSKKFDKAESCNILPSLLRI